MTLATPEQLNTYWGSTFPGVAGVALRDAEVVVRGLLVNDWFAVNQDGDPIETKYQVAIRDAICAQVAFTYWRTHGPDDESGEGGEGTSEALKGFSLGPLSLNLSEDKGTGTGNFREGYPAAPGLPEVSLLAYQTLRNAGLASGQVTWE